MKDILVISFSNLKTDARVQRQINFIKKKFNITVACYDAHPSADYKIILLKEAPFSLLRKAISGTLLLLGIYYPAYIILYSYFYLKKELHGKNFDVIIANDIETLPLAFSISKKSNILFDAHEYYPALFEDKLMWRIFFKGLNLYLCKKYLPRVQAMTTVSMGIANEYKKKYHVDPIVITNAPNFKNLNPSPIDETSIKMVHHGGAIRSRKLELMIDLMNYLDDRYSLDMFLLTPHGANKKTKAYLSELRERAKKSKIKILAPLKSDEIISTINQYDLGIYIMPPINFNQEQALPNKFFDFIQARLAIAIGPTPEMAEIVRKYSLGVVSKDFAPESLAEEIQKIGLEQLKKFKQNSSVAAEKLNANNNEELFVSMIENLLKNEAPSRSKL